MVMMMMIPMMAEHHNHLLPLDVAMIKTGLQVVRMLKGHLYYYYYYYYY